MSPEILEIPIERILVGERLRAVNPDWVQLLAASMAETGQQTAIEVAPADIDGEHRLIAGAHRLAAARQAGLTAAPALPLELAAWRAVAQCAAASEAARVLAVMPFDSRPDAIAARDAVADAMASAADALAEAGLHDAWTEMLGLRAAVVQDTSARAARLSAWPAW